VPHSEFVKDIWVKAGEIRYGHPCTDDVVNYLHRYLTRLSDLVGADRSEAQLFGGTRNDKIQDTIGSTAFRRTVGADRRDEETFVV